MARWFAAALGGLALLAPVGAKAQPSIITNPDWAVLPKGEDMARTYPGLAAKLGIEGRVLLACNVAETGALQNCRVAEASPEKLGFDKAALAMSDLFRMSPRLRNGAPVAGGQVRIPIHFALPPAADAPRAKAIVDEPSAVAKEVAGQLLIVNRVEDRMTAISAPSYDLDPEIVREGEAALAAAFQEVRPEFVRASADLLDRRFGEANLATLNQMLSGRARSSLERLGAKRAKLDQEASQILAVQLMMETRRIACAQLQCQMLESDALRTLFDRANAIAAEAPHGTPAPLRYPTVDEIRKVMPKIPFLLGVGGGALARCKIDPTGSAETCTVEYEAPKGWGFGPAAIALARTASFAPGPVDMGIGGRWAIVPAVFPAMPPVKLEPESPEAAPEQRLVAAREILAPAMSRSKNQLSDTLVRLVKADEGTPPETLAIVRAAMAEAYPDLEKQFWERQARGLAAAFSDEEMDDVLAFTRSPVGQAFAARETRWLDESAGVARPFQARVTTIARERFCQKVSCRIESATARPKN